MFLIFFIILDVMKKRELEFRLRLKGFYDHFLNNLFNQKYAWELNDQQTRDRIRVDFEKGLLHLGVQVKCNEENNPPEIVDQGGMIITVSKQFKTGSWIHIDLPLGSIVGRIS